MNMTQVKEFVCLEKRKRDLDAELKQVKQELAGPAILAPLRSPRGLAVAESGTVYLAANQRIYRLSSEGMVSTLPKTEGNPRYVAVDAKGGLIVSEELAGRSAQIVRLEGARLTRLVSDLRMPGGLALDPSGNLYFTDPVGNRIGRLGVDGTVETLAVTALTLSLPEAIAVDAAGTVYVADSWNRIVKVAPRRRRNSDPGVHRPGPEPGAGPGRQPVRHR